MDFSRERIKKFKWPVSVSRKYEAPPWNIWSAIAKPGNLRAFHPFCEKNPVYEWPGVGSKDAVYYYSGWVLQRKFINWIDGVGYDLLIGREGGRKSYVSWRITDERKDISTLKITIYPHSLQNIPTAIRWIPHIAAVQPSLNRYLDAVLKGLEWFINSGKPVRKNQFGSHKWFSSNDVRE